MKKVATIILNRNLPRVTEKLFDHIKKYDGELTDIYVVEVGAIEIIFVQKLHGMQIGMTLKKRAWDIVEEWILISNLFKEKKFFNYDAFFLLTNDTELERKKLLSLCLKYLKNIKDWEFYHHVQKDGEKKNY